MSIWTKLVRWWRNQDEIDVLTVLNDVQAAQIRALREDVVSLDRSGSQVLFLLTQAPIMDAPTTMPFAGVGAKFVYIHPATFSKLMRTSLDFGVLKTSVCSHGPKSSRWVLTPLLPEGRVIYSANQMPGLESLIARQENAYANR